MDLPTYRAVARELDAAHDQLAREHKSLTSEAAMPELPDPSQACEDLSTKDRRALTEMLVDKIVISQHPHEMVDAPDGRRKRSYTIRAIPYQDPVQEARGSRQCTTPGSRSSQGPERVVDRAATW